MKRIEAADRPFIPAEAVTLEQRLHDIEIARNAGHLVLECGPPALDGHQILTLNPEGGSDGHYWFDWRESHSVAGTDTQHRISTGHISGIAYEGVKRRQGWLRRYEDLNIAPEEISAGDVIAFRIGEEVFSSQPVREISVEPALAVAKNRLRVPELAISAE